MDRLVLVFGVSLAVVLLLLVDTGAGQSGAAMIAWRGGNAMLCLGSGVALAIRSARYWSQLNGISKQFLGVMMLWAASGALGNADLLRRGVDVGYGAAITTLAVLGLIRLMWVLRNQPVQMQFRR